ncbi:hypothetical protein MHYP_G00017680 [Metynnis hypsauchen]
MKPGLKKDAVGLTLDPNTLSSFVSLSEGNRKVEFVRHQPDPDHPHRFAGDPDVLSVESLTGRCYWEAQWSGDKACISVSYRGVIRNEDYGSGESDESWSLECSKDGYMAFYGGCGIGRSDPPFNRVGVYLDWGSGTVSFYTISPNTHTLTHLRTFYNTFTEPLYAGLCVYPDSSASLCETE